jgi:hypothetical protein
MTIQIIGSVGVLTGFILSQLNIVNPKSLSYLLINAIGSGLLAIDAIIESQWGFLLLEGAWAVVSIAGLIRLGLARKKAESQPPIS